MTIKELIEHLSSLPDDTKVVVDTSVGFLELHRLPVFDKMFKLDDKYFDRNPFYIEQDWENVVVIKV